MIKQLIKQFKNVSLSPEEGSFLSDKSYKYDTVFYISNYLLDKMDNTHVFNIRIYKDDCQNFVEEKFSLKKGSTAAINYLREVLNLLIFAGYIKKENSDTYKIEKIHELRYISKSFENSYIFLFILTYMTLKNENIIITYLDYIKSKNIKEKEFYLKCLFEKITSKSKRVSDPQSVWGKLTVKYPIMVLGLYFNEMSVSKSLNISDEYISVKSLSMNVSGTKSLANVSKNNEYIFKFNINYVNKNIEYFLKKIK